MNATSNNVVDGESVTLSCLLKYRTNSASREENVRVMIELPRAEVIDTKTEYSRNEVSSAVTVKAVSSKNTEEPTSFGPVQCNVEFMQPLNDAELARNSVQFASDEIPEFHILSKCFQAAFVCCSVE